MGVGDVAGVDIGDSIELSMLKEEMLVQLDSRIKEKKFLGLLLLKIFFL